MAPDAWFFGDESNLFTTNRFFGLGVLATRHPNVLISHLRDMRRKTGYPYEVSYKGSERRRVLCAIKWMDWFFGPQKCVHFKIVIKDRKTFDYTYFSNNKFGARGQDLAYCETYREALSNLAGFNDCSKGVVYSEIKLPSMKIDKYLMSRVNGLAQCVERSPKEVNSKTGEFTGSAEALQLCDLLTSTSTQLCEVLHGSTVESNCFVKSALMRNIRMHCDGLESQLKTCGNFYHPEFLPHSDQKFSVYFWKK